MVLAERPLDRATGRGLLSSGSAGKSLYPDRKTFLTFFQHSTDPIGLKVVLRLHLDPARPPALHRVAEARKVELADLIHNGGRKRKYMATEPKKAKPDYQAKLAARAKQLVEALGIQPENGYSIILETLKETALESWKNGIEAGRRKANRPPKTA